MPENTKLYSALGIVVACWVIVMLLVLLGATTTTMEDNDMLRLKKTDDGIEIKVSIVTIRAAEDVDAAVKEVMAQVTSGLSDLLSDIDTYDMVTLDAKGVKTCRKNPE